MNDARAGAGSVAKTLRALIVEDSEVDAELIAHALRETGYALESERVQSADAMRAALARGWDIVLCDHDMPGFDSRQALQILKETGRDIPFIVVSGSIADETAIEVLREGARDYLTKQRLLRLPAAVERELAAAVQRRARRRAEIELERQRAFLRRVIDLDRNFIFATDADGRFILANQAVAEAYGTTVERLLGSTDRDLSPGAPGVGHFGECDIEVMETLTEAFLPEESVTDAAGRVHWLQTTKSPIVAQQGEPIMVLTVATDITERKGQEERLARLNRIHAVRSSISATIAGARDRTALLREACRIAVGEGELRTAWIGLTAPGAGPVKPVAWAGFGEDYLNEVGAQLEDIVRADGCGGIALREKRPVIANDVATDTRVLNKQEAIEHGCLALAVFPLLVKGDAAGILVLHAAHPGHFDDNEVALLQGLTADIAFALDHLAKADEINYLAAYDPMTGLANRRLFYDRLNQVVSLAAKEAAQTGVVVININRFRFINYAIGRPGGDAVLKAVAERLREAISVRARLARIGADAFAIVMPRVHDAAQIAATLGEKVLSALANPVQIGEEELRLSVKAGIALAPRDGTDADTLMKNAEAALEKAKGGGEQFVFYATHMNQAAAGKLKLEAKLQKALEAGQFVLHYQPKVSLTTGLISGMEALMRWNDPEEGLVSPLAFIPMLEESGMILEVGQWALGQAVSDALALHAKGVVPPRIAVNVSPIQLGQIDFVSAVEKVLGPARGTAAKIELEITESVIMQDIQANIQKLRAVREMGVEVAIDDFGTGYSSLSYLSKLPLSTLKIDRAFVVHMTTNPDDVSIVSTIISLAHALNLKVVAEGVEHHDQAYLLRVFNCDELQGYLFSRPVTIDVIEQYLREKKALALTVK